MLQPARIVPDVFHTLICYLHSPRATPKRMTRTRCERGAMDVAKQMCHRTFISETPFQAATDPKDQQLCSGDSGDSPCIWPVRVVPSHATLASSRSF